MDAAFETLARKFRSGAWSAADNILKAAVTPPVPGDIAVLPPRGSEERRALEARGEDALRQGKLGLVILAGGMATRFNWDRPKGVYPIYEGKSFLGWKLEWARVICGDRLPIYIMTSFHTQDAVAAHLAEHEYFGVDPDRVRLFQQFRYPRLLASGEGFVDPRGQEDSAAPGHGDFPAALRQAGLLAEFLAAGGTTLLFSNVDNLGATPDMAIVGWHLASGVEMTAEVAAKAPGDRGGAPARVDGRLQLVEGFAFPPDVDQNAIGVFNTATYCFEARALDRDFELPWYVVEKQVDATAVIQFEHLAGDLSASLKFGAVQVDRDDRFIPVKGQADVAQAQILLARKAQSLHGALSAR